MSFPYHDPFWRDAGDFLAGAVAPNETVLAPDSFWWRFRRIERFVSDNLVVPPPYDWIVVHKGDLRALPRPFVDAVRATMRPVFANEVFVIWTAATRDPALGRDEPNVRSFLVPADTLPIRPVDQLKYEQDVVLGTAPAIQKYEDLTAAEFRAAYNAFFATTGYQYPTGRDRAYFEEIHRWLATAAARWAQDRVLEICCAAVPYVDPASARFLVRTDLAEQAVKLAAAADGSRPGPGSVVTHAVTDAHELCFPDRSFDGVAFVDSIEHVHDAQRVLRESARVLRPDGELLLTFANRNSVNYVINRKLGYPDFVTNYQHIAEFGFDEILAMLDDADLDVIDTGGIELMPYWGIPGVDEAVRAITDDDPDVVEMLRELGRRAGPEYAYTGVVLAKKRQVG